VLIRAAVEHDGSGGRRAGHEPEEEGEGEPGSWEGTGHVGL
jgi:hypothetical protein